MHREQWQLLAAYNTWMNEKVYEASARLASDELRLDRNAFFGSIIGTLNHLAVGDTIWLKRFRAHLQSAALELLDRIPAPERLDQMLFEDFQELTKYRKNLDRLISTLAETITEDDLGSVMHYKNVKGIESSRRFAALLLHFFNHQTHHRGQAVDLLYQAGINVGVTDLLALIPETH
jgi:uncharacterized damage-inducible protein DinB